MIDCKGASRVVANAGSPEASNNSEIVSFSVGVVDSSMRSTYSCNRGFADAGLCIAIKDCARCRHAVGWLGYSLRTRPQAMNASSHRCSSRANVPARMCASTFAGSSSKTRCNFISASFVRPASARTSACKSSAWTLPGSSRNSCKRI